MGLIVEELYYRPFTTTAVLPPELGTVRLLNSALDRFRESVEPMFASWPLVHLSFLQAKLMMKRHPSCSPEEIFTLALNIVFVLCAEQNSKTPLIHHFAGLAAVALVEGLQIAKTNDAALRGLQDLRFWLEKSQSGNANWEAIIANYIASKVPASQQPPPSNGTPIDRGGLQHLADAAVGETEAANGDRAADEAPRAAETEVTGDWTTVPVKGYMRILNPFN